MIPKFVLANTLVCSSGSNASHLQHYFYFILFYLSLTAKFSELFGAWYENEFLVSKETGAASVGEIKTKIWFYQTS